MRWIYRILPALLMLCLPACALGEEAAATPAPPITLPAPPPLLMEGDCTGTAGLDEWLQTTELHIAEFQNTVNSAANQPREQLYEPVVHMARVRDATNALAAPDCVVSTHLLLVETMNNAIDNFQAYANGDQDSLGSTVPETISQFDRVIAGHNELKARLEAQYQSRNNG